MYNADFIRLHVLVMGDSIVMERASDIAINPRSFFYFFSLSLPRPWRYIIGFVILWTTYDSHRLLTQQRHKPLLRYAPDWCSAGRPQTSAHGSPDRWGWSAPEPARWSAQPLMVMMMMQFAMESNTLNVTCTTAIRDNDDLVKCADSIFKSWQAFTSSSCLLLYLERLLVRLSSSYSFCSLGQPRHRHKQLFVCSAQSKRDKCS